MPSFTFEEGTALVATSMKNGTKVPLDVDSRIPLACVRFLSLA